MLSLLVALEVGAWSRSLNRHQRLTCSSACMRSFAEIELGRICEQSLTGRSYREHDPVILGPRRLLVELWLQRRVKIVRLFNLSFLRWFDPLDFSLRRFLLALMSQRSLWSNFFLISLDRDLLLSEAQSWSHLILLEFHVCRLWRRRSRRQLLFVLLLVH